MNPAEKYERITRNLQETLGGESLLNILNERELSLYWGTATTGRPHLGYFVPICKIADFLSAGCQVKILLADLHAYLDNQKAPWDLLHLRTEYYKHLITAMLNSVGVDTSQLVFVIGTSFQLSREYSLDAYRLAAVCTEHDAKKAGAEVVKQVSNPLLSGLIYPGLQALDEEYLKVDAQFGGTDQRKIFTFAEKYLPVLGYKKRAHLMNFMVPGLMGSKMSSSDPDSKIDILESPESVARKIKKAFCEAGNITENGLLSFCKYVVFPLYTLTHKDGNQGFLIRRKEEWGGDLVFKTYSELEEAFKTEKVHPGDLKTGVTDAINALLAPIRAYWEARPELIELTAKAYPEQSLVNAMMALAPPSSDSPPMNKKSLPKLNGDAKESFEGLDLRVGQLTHVTAHTEADTLFTAKLNIGAGIPPRSIVMGLAKHYEPTALENRLVVALLNLKPRAVKGVLSEGMVLCGQGDGDGLVKVLDPPTGSQVGEHVQFLTGTEAYVTNASKEAAAPINVKQKWYGQVMGRLAVDEEGVAILKGSKEEDADRFLVTSAGRITVDQIRNGRIG